MISSLVEGSCEKGGAWGLSKRTRIAQTSSTIKGLRSIIRFILGLPLEMALKPGCSLEGAALAKSPPGPILEYVAL
jgi:hypothetical protein